MGKTIVAVILLSLLYITGEAEETYNRNLMMDHPEWYIKIPDWDVYAGWSCPAIIHHVTIENTSDITYKDIKIRVRYYSTSSENYGTQIAQETGVLPVTVPPHSKETYLEKGATLGAGCMAMYAGGLEVLGATTVLNGE
jgi:hypothetical protein